jgi:hypothetical protein
VYIYIHLHKKKDRQQTEALAPGSTLKIDVECFPEGKSKDAHLRLTSAGGLCPMPLVGLKIVFSRVQKPMVRYRDLKREQP